MSHCEDFPCCGHEYGDCPDSEGRMKCVDCGTRLKKDATSSICDSCMINYIGFDVNDRPEDDGEYDEFIEESD